MYQYRVRGRLWAERCDRDHADAVGALVGVAAGGDDGQPGGTGGPGPNCRRFLQAIRRTVGSGIVERVGRGQ